MVEHRQRPLSWALHDRSSASRRLVTELQTSSRHQDELMTLFGAILLLIAVPTVLALAIAATTSRQFSFHDVPGLHGAFDALTAMAWIAWAKCCAPIVRSTIHRMRRRDITASPGSKLSERIAARLTAGLLVLTPAVTLTTAIETSTANMNATTMAAFPSQGVHRPGSVSRRSPVRPASSSLDARRTSPTTAGAVVSTAMPSHRGPSTKATPHLVPDGVRTMPPTARLVRSSMLRRAPGAPLSGRHVPAPTRRARQQANVTTSSGDTNGGPPNPLPELCALALGALGSAALARRAHLQRRARRRAIRGEPTATRHGADRGGPAQAGAVNRPGCSENLPTLDWVGAANRQLGHALAADRRSIPTPRLLCVGREGLDLVFTDAINWAPPGWQLGDDGLHWHLVAQEQPDLCAPEATDATPRFPVLLPIGENDAGSWLVAADPGTSIAVVGPLRDELIDAMSMAARELMPTTDLILTPGEGALEGRGYSPLPDPRSGAAPDLPVLCFGPSEDLTAAQQACCVALTTSLRSPTDLTIVVDRRGATIHPFGIALRPQAMCRDRREEGPQRSLGNSRLDDSTAETLSPPIPATEALAPTSCRPGSTPLDLPSPSRPGDTQPTVHPRRIHDRCDPEIDAELAPGDLEVRLLTAIPRIDGLTSPFPSKRARRGVEVVAYLALHHPEPVTGDRMRTRVLGSPDADAAAKTLFNTVGAARRTLGVDRDGRLYLPPASKSGHYRLSERVTVDVVRSMQLVAAGRRAPSLEHEIGLYRAAIALIEGEPLAGVLSGYGWWRPEGHEVRLATTLVDAACRLSRLAIEVGLLELARWAVDRVRLIDPYGEALSRAAMEVAAAAGDRTWLQREWSECQRRVREIDPDGSPTEATQRLFADLSRRTDTHPNASDAQLHHNQDLSA